MNTQKMIEEDRRNRFLIQLEKLRPIDDDFMRLLIKGNFALAERIFQILEDDYTIELEQLETQVDMKVPGARSIELDVLGVTKDHRCFNLETERKKERGRPERARYHSSMLDIKNLFPQQEFVELPETHMIFITEYDMAGLGKPRYYVRKKETEELDFWDRSEIMYVNAQYRDDTEFGKLMADFLESDPEKMQIREMREACNFLKNTEEGRKYMCEIFEQIRAEGRAEGIDEGGTVMLDILSRRKAFPGEPLEKTAKAVGCPVEQVRKAVSYKPRSWKQQKKQ